ncbi:MAG: sensor histidine kinase [Kibdelosporangium sp.]
MLPRDALGRHALAPLRGLALFGLSLVALVQGAAAFLISFAGTVRLFEVERWLPNLCRRLVGAWLGIGIPVPYLPKPGPPQPEADGWYRDGNQLYRKPQTVVRKQRFNWLLQDPATHRDHLWALLTPVTGGLAAVLPAALIVGAFWAPLWVAIPMVVLGFAGGPVMLAVYGRWTGALLGPSGRTSRSAFWKWVMSGAWSLLLLAGTAGLSLIGFVYAVLQAMAFFPGLMGPLPPIVRASRTFVATRRDQIRAWSGVAIAEPYLPPAPPPTPRPDGKYQFGRQLVDSPKNLQRVLVLKTIAKDQATWRDLGWLLLDPIVSLVLAGLPVLLAVSGFCVYFWSWLWSVPISLFTDFDLRAGWAYLGDWLPMLNSAPRWVTPVAGLVFTVLALAASQALLKLHGRWSRLLLAPTKSAELAHRVNQLTRSRSDATDTQAAELRRIERDLHDGAQARWVAMGLNLGAVERLIDQDPETAKRLLANARNASAEALVELRRLVRGIHPPVLAERGLGDAVRALALDSALDVHVAVEVPGRIEAPVEAALYFAISELLTNVAKHAHARRASIDIRYYDGRVRVTVTDDGRGGAEVVREGGLQGVRKRLATFDGELSLASPPGGPTTATMEVPCALSSPRTSTSSETA